MKYYKVKAILEVEYEITSEDLGEDDGIENAVETAKGWLLEKIDHRNVAYDELTGEALRLYDKCEYCDQPFSGWITKRQMMRNHEIHKDGLHTTYKGRIVAR